MKKNITINICGQLYAIDEDACKLLEQYLDNMKRYFARREGGDEIADDIEHRVAEHLADLKAQGVEAVTIDHVRDIISQIGNPEQMDDGDDTADTTQQPPEPPQSDDALARGRRWLAGRRLYRDPDDKMLSGLTAGLCKYFGSTDPLPWRIALVVLAFVSFSTIGILYLIGWMVVPEARTAEDRLRMQGKPVNPTTLSEEVVNRANGPAGRSNFASMQTQARGCLGTMLTICVWAFKALALFVLAISTVVGCAFTVFLGFLTVIGPKTMVDNGLFEADTAQLWQAHPALYWMSWGIAIFTLVFLGILVYSLIRSFIRRTDDKRLSIGTRVTLVVVALISLAASISLTAIMSGLCDHWSDENERVADTRDGYYLRSYDRGLLAENGWTIKLYQNCNSSGYVYESTDELVNEDSVEGDWDECLTFKAVQGKPMRVQLERTETLAPGWYHLEAVAMARGGMAYVYAAPSDTSRVAAPIPVSDMRGTGNLLSLSADQLSTTNLFALAARHDTAWYTTLTAAGQSWSFVRSRSFYYPGGSLRLGVTNIPTLAGLSATTSTCQRFSLYDLRVVGDVKP